MVTHWIRRPNSFPNHERSDLSQLPIMKEPHPNPFISDRIGGLASPCKKFAILVRLLPQSHLTCSKPTELGSCRQKAAKIYINMILRHTMSLFRVDVAKCCSKTGMSELYMLHGVFWGF